MFFLFSMSYALCFIYILFSPYKQRGGGALPDFLFLLYFPCSANHERDWPPYNVPGSFFYRIDNQYAECEKHHEYQYVNVFDFLLYLRRLISRVINIDYNLYHSLNSRLE